MYMFFGFQFLLWLFMYFENQGFVMFFWNVFVDCVLQKLEKEMVKIVYILKWVCIKVNDDMMEVRSVEKKCRDLEYVNVRMVVVIEKIKKSNN